MTDSVYIIIHPSESPPIDRGIFIESFKVVIFFEEMIKLSEVRKETSLLLGYIRFFPSSNVKSYLLLVVYISMNNQQQTTNNRVHPNFAGIFK